MAEKLNMASTNIADKNFEVLLKLFPNALTETITGYDENGNAIIERAIDADVLRQEISCTVVEGRDERYQFTWPDKKKAVLLANSPITETLRPIRDASVNFEDTENVYIEGDNLDVLKLLQETYLGKIKIIYIDPPYNTGHDFVYNDDFAESVEEYVQHSGQYDEVGNKLLQNTENNGRFHTDWLNMVYSRLKLAKNLLTEDGVIFISIDDNEQGNLTKICDEVFGTDNCLGPIIQNKMNAKNDTIDIQKNHEFILVYRKSCRYDGTKVIPTLVNKVMKRRDVFEENGQYYYINDSITTRGEGGTLNARPNLGYSVYYNPTTKEKIAVADYDVELAKKLNNEQEVYTERQDLIERGFVVIRPPKVRGKLGCWTWALDKFNKESKYIVVTGKPGNYAVKKRTFVDRTKVVYEDERPQIISMSYTNSRSLLEFSTNEGTNTLSKVLDNLGIFSNPKNLDMMSYLINLIDDKECYILDFFSGSATTAHAVMRLNAKDKGKRKFIMVQVPEEINEGSEAQNAGFTTICEIGEERIRRAGKKIKEENPDAIDLDIGFRVLKLDSSNMKDVYYNPSQMEQQTLFASTDNIKEDRTPEDLLFQVMLDLGVLLSSKIEEKVIAGKKVFNVAEGFLIACFDSDITEETVKAVAQEKPYYAVFRDSSMANDSVATNFEQIFATYSPGTVRKVL